MGQQTEVSTRTSVAVLPTIPNTNTDVLPNNNSAYSELERITREELTIPKMRSILEKFGFEFHPKTNKAQIPAEITNERLTMLAGDDPEKLQRYRIAFDGIKEYLDGEIITDRFIKHEDRRAFRLWMESEEFRREAFIEAYERPNQLRINRITAVIGNIQNIARKLTPQNAQLGERLLMIKDFIKHIIYGDDTTNSKKYDDMTIEEKINVVETIKTKVIEVLKLIAGPDAKRTEIFI